MQEIFSLITLRINAVSELNQLFQEHRQNLTSSNKGNSNPIKKEFVTYLTNLRREEKTRISRENEFLELIYTLRNFDDSQLLIFQETSYSLMQKMFPSFVYENYEANGTVKSIAKVFLKLLQALNLNSKAADLKKAYNTHKNLNENLREKQALFENPTEAAIYYRNGQTLDADAKTHGTCPTPCFDERGNNNHMFVIRKREQNPNVRRASNPATINKSEDVEFLQYRSIEVRRNSTRFCPQNEGVGQTKGLSEAECVKLRAVPITLPSEVVSQKNNNYLDILGDLEPSLPVTIQMNKKKYKAGESTSFTVDFEKKREMIIQQYQSSISRNNYIEKSIDNYKKIMFSKKKIKYDPNESQLKGENYLEQYSLISLVHRFAYLIEPGFKRQSALFVDQRPSRPLSVQPKRQHLQNLLQPVATIFRMNKSKNMTINGSTRENCEEMASIQQEERTSVQEESAHITESASPSKNSQTDRDKPHQVQGLPGNRPKERNTVGNPLEYAKTYKGRPKTDIRSIKLDGFSLGLTKNNQESINETPEITQRKKIAQAQYAYRSASTGNRQRQSKLIVNTTNPSQNGKQLINSPLNWSIVEKHAIASYMKSNIDTKVSLINSAVDPPAQQLIAEIISKNPRQKHQSPSKRPSSAYRHSKHYKEYFHSQATEAHTPEISSYGN